MNLFIRIQDGQPFEHPMFEENFRQVFPDVDVANLPSEFARFVRVAPPLLGPYEVYEGVTYVRDGDAFTDEHRVRPMTDTEKLEKQAIVKAQWADSGMDSWVFEEPICVFRPPTDPPNDGKVYRWDEPTQSWVEIELQQE